MLGLGCKCEHLTKEQVLYNLLYIIRNNEGEKLENLVCDFVKNYFKNEDEKQVKISLLKLKRDEVTFVTNRFYQGRIGWVVFLSNY